MPKRVAMVEWNWTGHHSGFFASFVLALEEIGANVLALCPFPNEAEEAVRILRLESGSGSVVPSSTSYESWPQIRKRLTEGRLARIGRIEWQIRHFTKLEKTIRQWEATTGKGVDLIFYACVYEWDFDALHLIAPFLTIPWAGLYLQPLSIRTPGRRVYTGRLPEPRKVFGGSLCRAVGTFDEGIPDLLSQETGKPVVVFPDLPNLSMPASKEDLLLNRLRFAAENRPIVGSFGSLIKSKGFHTLAEIARLPGMRKFFFAFVGELPPHGPRTKDDLTFFDTLSTYENTWSHLAWIRNEAQFNLLISECQVLYVAYIDFPNSSNMLAKAAWLRKPVIVSEGHLLAERVRKYNLGIIVPQQDAVAQAAAMEPLLSDTDTWVRSNNPQWEAYLQEHSFQRLKSSFIEVLSHV